MMTRRSMIQSLTASAGALWLSESAAAILTDPPRLNPPFMQAQLPYALDALEPFIDRMTMEIHYSKHAAGYCANLNRAVADHAIDIKGGLESIFSSISSYPVALRNHGGGHYNHELFWQCMKPGGAPLTDSAFRTVLIRSFGTIGQFQKIFSEAALSRFGSGWAWLILNKEGQLIVDSTPNQDNPLMDIASVKGFPLLGLDVWEHAYYLTYQNRRAEYIKQWWEIVDWSFVSSRYLQIQRRLQEASDRF